MSNPPILASVLKSRGAVLELVVAAVILALGVNMLAASVAIHFGANTNVMLWASLTLILLSVGLIARRTIAATYVSRTLEGFFCYHKGKNELIKVPRYDFSEELSSYVEGLFAENEAPRKLWEADPISNTFKQDVKAGTLENRTTAAGQLLMEATEYFVLEKLSTHLTDYFNHADFDDRLLQELSREDIPSVVFKNRFLDTFSRPMQERAAFVDSTLKREETFGKISSSYGPGGVRYENFDLVLPSKAKVSRTSTNRIEIDTPKLCLNFEVDFAGFNANLPRGFERLYLDGLQFGDAQAFKVNISTTIKFKALSLFSQSGWQYHAWLDSFLASLERDFSEDEFFERIDWNRAMTVARVVQRTLVEANDKSSAPANGT